jgi:hypothetical protein
VPPGQPKKLLKKPQARAPIATNMRNYCAIFADNIKIRAIFTHRPWLDLAANLI